MSPILITILLLATFGTGLVTGLSIASIRHRSAQYMRQALERARTQGRLEAMRRPTGNEPPAPWN